ncbi:MAG: hypothetical protein HUU10_04250 [Bacteroidetes bacterium]|nr:hypothetical protein [Bacteroidota bacterium]
MKRNHLFIIVFVLSALVGCQPSKKEVTGESEADKKIIDIVRKSDAMGEGVNWETFIAHAAGLKGKIDWRYFRGEEKQHVVELKMLHYDDKTAAVDTLRMQWQVNPETGFNKLSYFAINSVAQPKMLGMMKLELWVALNR